MFRVSRKSLSLSRTKGIVRHGLEMRGTKSIRKSQVIALGGRLKKNIFLGGGCSHASTPITQASARLLFIKIGICCSLFVPEFRYQIGAKRDGRGEKRRERWRRRGRRWQRAHVSREEWEEMRRSLSLEAALQSATSLFLSIAAHVTARTNPTHVFSLLLLLLPTHTH